jgi:hypothetical protein
MYKRYINKLETNLAYYKTERHLEQTFRDEGYNKLIDITLLDLNKVGLKKLYEQLDLAKNYQVNLQKYLSIL